MEDCVFCRIVSGDVPAKTIYEDEDHLAFLSIAPFAKGHAVVIPKKHTEDILSADDDVARSLMSVTKQLSVMLMDKLNADGVNLHNNSGKAAEQEVFHLHLHIVPRFNDDKISFGGAGGTLPEINLDAVHSELNT